MMITIHDSLPGSGKSSRMIEMINHSPEDDRWIVVVPFLEECHRYAGTCIDEDSGDNQLPLRDDKGRILYNRSGCNASGREFIHPDMTKGSKVEHIQFLVEQGRDIVTTHAALKLFTPETIAAIKDARYTLLIDESLEVITPHLLSGFRRQILLDSGAIYEDEEGLLRWNSDKYVVSNNEDVDDNGYSWDRRIKSLCDNGSLILADKGGNRTLLMWEYPSDFLKSFDNIHVLTYLFEGSIMQKYMEYHNMEHTIEYGIRDIPDKSLILVVDNDRMNRVGERINVFSATDSRKIRRDSALAKDVRKHTENFFTNSTYGKSQNNNRMWTCLKDSKEKFKGKGYTKSFVPHNIKAVNTYSNVSHLAYIYNAYMLPEIYKYLFNRGEQYTPNEDVYSLSQLLQWIYRSRVRKQQPISLYIPSSRMRGLLLDWIEN